MNGPTLVARDPENGGLLLTGEELELVGPLEGETVSHADHAEGCLRGRRLEVFARRR